MRHQLVLSLDGTSVAHYAPNTELLSVHRFTSKQALYSSSSVSPVESLSLRISPVSTLCIHPKLPVILGITLKKSNINAIPRGPSSSSSSSSSNTTENGSSNNDSQASKSRIPLTLYTYYTRPIVSTPLIIEVESPDDGALSPWCMKYSPCGKYLALHTRSYFTNSSYKPTTYQLYIFDVEKNYAFMAYTKLETGLDDIEWNAKSTVLLTAGTNGQLYVFNFKNINESNGFTLEYLQKLNLSSSSLSTISYYEDTENVDDSAILVGTRDGNTLFIDPTTMITTLSIFTEIDSPVLKVSMGPDKSAIITYISYTNEPAHIIRITAHNDEYKELAKITDIYPPYNPQNSYSTTGCGVLLSRIGVVTYVKKDGKLCFKTLQDLISPKTSTSSSSNEIKKSTTSSSSSSNQKKRSLDLFDRVVEKDESSQKQQKDNKGLANPNYNNNKQRDYYDNERRDNRYKRMNNRK